MTKRDISGHVVEAGVPIPRKGSGRPRKWHWPWLGGAMAVGESVFFAGISESDAASLSRSLTVCRQQHGQRFTRRKTIENGTPGVRVWRTA